MAIHQDRQPIGSSANPIDLTLDSEPEIIDLTFLNLPGGGMRQSAAVSDVEMHSDDDPEITDEPEEMDLTLDSDPEN